MKKRCKKALFSFYRASNAILRISVLEKIFSFLGLSMWYHQRSCSNGRKEWVSRILLSFHTEAKGHLCGCTAHRTCLHTQLFFSLFCMDSFIKRNDKVKENTTACVRVDSQWQVCQCAKSCCLLWADLQKVRSLQYGQLWPDPEQSWALTFLTQGPLISPSLDHGRGMEGIRAVHQIAITT